MKAPRLRLAVEELEGRVLLSAVLSSNWSGYVAMTSLQAAQASAVSAVAGSWNVPSVTGSSGSYSAVWVGIDGYSSPTVEQIGTLQYMGAHGRAAYVAWYEMYPAAPVYLNTFGFNISPGDSISAAVSYSAAGFNLQITNSTQSESYSTTKALASAQRSSAEWIVEAPSSNTGVLPLANFGTVGFSNASATISGTPGAIDTSANTAINMVSAGKTIATTSGLTDSNGTSAFTVTFTGSTSGGGGAGGGGGGKGHHGPDIPVNTIPGSPGVVVVLPGTFSSQPVALLAQPAIQPPVNGFALSNPIPAAPPSAPQTFRYEAAVSGVGFAPIDSDGAGQENAPGVIEAAPTPDNTPADPSPDPESVSSLGVAAGDASVQAVSGFFAGSFLAEEEMGGLTVDARPAVDIASGAGLALLVLGLNLHRPVKEFSSPAREKRARRLAQWL